MDLETLGYFLYMQKMEEQKKVNDEEENDLEREVPTTNEEKNFQNLKSRK